MGNPVRSLFLLVYRISFRLYRPLLFRRSAQQAHTAVLKLLERADNHALIRSVLKSIHRLAYSQRAITVGGVKLPRPFILAAGFVKGTGFESEAEALAAVQRGDNIIPGWRSMPAMVGLVEFGSYTRRPLLGNPGTVIWRDPATQSTQNRVGLKNPGAVPAATFLSQHKDALPETFGINIAPNPGITDPEQEKQDVLEAIQAFTTRKVYPSWFTLNLSCPNTEDDPGNHQTESNTYDLCNIIVQYLDALPVKIPLWVKVSPAMADSQYAVLMRVFHETGVCAVIATNTIAHPTPDDPTLQAGIAGGELHAHTVEAVRILAAEKAKHGYTVDIIACGGVQDKVSYQEFTQYTVKAAQYYSVMIYRGPLAAALLQ